MSLDETHDPTARSWVASANQDSDFPIQNLPFGVFRHRDDQPRGGVAIGDRIVDLAAGLERGLFSGEGLQAAIVASGGTLNPLFALPPSATSALRRQLFAALREGAVEAGEILVPQADVAMEMPITVGAFTDFLCSYDHAFRMSGGTPAPAFLYLPIAYNGRASSIGVDDHVRRPRGQYRAADGSVHYGAEPMLDYELELGIVLRSGNPIGTPLTLPQARDAIFGYCLLNDWSARGIQFLETQPLGPFLGKNFATTISPWIVTAEALEPYRVAAQPRKNGAPPTVPYLSDPENDARGGYDIELECRLLTPVMREGGLPATPIARTNARESYWTFAQMVTHHASNGCNLGAGDMLGSGTLSGSTDDSRACLAEVTKRGTVPFTLPNGEGRTYLEDGDELTLRGRASRPGAATIGFGECRAVILPAHG